MSNNRKKITGLLTIGLLLLVGIAGTFAYLSDKTETKRNVFTVGKVGITLAEPKWDQATSHKIIPGAILDKDPTITVTADSEPAYVFLEVTPSADFMSINELYTIDYDTSKWTKLTTGVGDKIVYYYTENVASSADAQVLAPLFTKVAFADSLTTGQLKELTTATIEVKGYAIQQSGFTSAALAWAELSK